MKGICVNGGACMYVGMCVLTHTHIHTQKMRESTMKGICVNFGA
jgi:hypothetical protein